MPLRDSVELAQPHWRPWWVVVEVRACQLAELISRSAQVYVETCGMRWVRLDGVVGVGTTICPV